MCGLAVFFFELYHPTLEDLFPVSEAGPGCGGEGGGGGRRWRRLGGGGGGGGRGAV